VTSVPNRRPLRGTRSICQRCRQPIVWATTLAGPNGPGGKSQPFDQFEDPAGNVAVRETGLGRLVARALGKDDALDQTTELRAMPHAATCARPEPRAAVLPAGVVDLAAARARKGRR
jgi:hypothetical protein